MEALGVGLWPLNRFGYGLPVLGESASARLITLGARTVGMTNVKG